MLLILNENITLADIEKLQQKLEWMGLHAVSVQHELGLALAILNAEKLVSSEQFVHLPEVAKVLPFDQKYKLVSINTQKQRTVIQIGDVAIGDPGKLIVMAGPCSVESEEQIEATAAHVATAGATILRGGIFKPRTSPYEFQGMGEEGMRYMQAAAKRNNLLTISEVMSIEQLDLLAPNIDILQIGARNMQNFNLLKAAGQTKKPILLKRGLSATYNELLLAAEYILSTGNPNVMLCERGIRTFESHTRNTLDLAAVPVLKSLTHLPVIVDPSHGVGIRQFIPDLAKAAIAVGADGIIIEVHPDPARALSDGPQSLTCPQFTDMMGSLHRVAHAVDRVI